MSHYQSSARISEILMAGVATLCFDTVVSYITHASIELMVSYFTNTFCKIIVTLPSIQLPSLIAPSSLSLIVQSQRLVGRFLHYLNVLLTYFLWRLTVARIQLHYLLPSLFARIPAF